ncbi:MAG TPA: hypothetical protein VHA56_10750 [Mucilaginibacter sp.]|nr:hypothetical protein [Mucilaginibacter sp.]
MSNRYKPVQYIIFVSVLIINITTLIDSVQKQETLRIVVGAFAIGLMCLAGIIFLIRRLKAKP